MSKRKGSMSKRCAVKLQTCSSISRGMLCGGSSAREKLENVDNWSDNKLLGDAWKSAKRWQRDVIRSGTAL